MIHQFHRLFGRDFEFVVHRQNWGEDRVHLYGANGELFSLPAAWTDVAPGHCCVGGSPRAGRLG